MPATTSAASAATTSSGRWLRSPRRAAGRRPRWRSPGSASSQEPSFIQLVAARSEEQFRDNLAAAEVTFTSEQRDRLNAVSRTDLGFPLDVMRESTVVGGVYGAQLADIDDPRAAEIRRTTTH